MPRYDLSWSATGPLIEKYGVLLFPVDHPQPGWRAAVSAYCESGPYHIDEELEHSAVGPTPLVAVCNLILELSKKGKL